MAQPEPTIPEPIEPDARRWNSVRRGLDQMFQGSVIVLIGIGVHLLLGDAVTRSRREYTGILEGALVVLVVLTGGVYSAIGCVRCLAAPRPHRAWMIGHLASLGAVALASGALLVRLFSGPGGDRAFGPVLIALFGAVVAATVAVLICLPYFISGISRAFGDESFAYLCRFICHIQVLWFLLQVGLTVYARLAVSGQLPKDLPDFGTDPDQRDALELVSRIVAGGSAIWHTVMLGWAQKTIAAGPRLGVGARDDT